MSVNPNPRPGRPPATLMMTGYESPSSLASLKASQAAAVARWRAKQDAWNAWELANPKPCCKTCGKEL